MKYKINENKTTQINVSNKRPRMRDNKNKRKVMKSLQDADSYAEEKSFKTSFGRNNLTELYILGSCLFQMTEE